MSIVVGLAMLCCVFVSTLAYGLSNDWGVDGNKVSKTELVAFEIQAASIVWLADEGECPTIPKLIAGEYLDADFLNLDEWGGTFSIDCVNDDVVIRSAGADKHIGSVDDVVVPMELRSTSIPGFFFL